MTLYEFQNLKVGHKLSFQCHNNPCPQVPLEILNFSLWVWYSDCWNISQSDKFSSFGKPVSHCTCRSPSLLNWVLLHSNVFLLFCPARLHPSHKTIYWTQVKRQLLICKRSIRWTCRLPVSHTVRVVWYNTCEHCLFISPSCVTLALFLPVDIYLLLVALLLTLNKWIITVAPSLFC